MRRTIGIGIVGFLWTAAAALGQAPPAKAPPPPLPPREGEVCVSGRWHTEGGNAARNAATRNAPLLRRPLVAWRLEPGGTLAGEPLVWDEFVVLGVEVNDKRRAIEVRRLQDGSLVGRREINSTTRPWPALWGNEVVWRVGDGGLELLRFDDRKLAFVTRMPGADQVGPPLRVGPHVYVVVDGHLTCMRAADFRVLWRTQDAGHRGPPSIAGDSLYVWRSVDGQQFAVVEHDRRSGKRLAQGPTIHLRRAPGEDSRLVVAGRTMLARLGDEHALADFVAPVALNALEFALPLQAAAELHPTSMPVLRAMSTRVQVGAFGLEDGKQLGLFPNGGDGGVRLDTCEVHRALADVPPTLAADVVYFGACAVETGQYRMLWRLQRDGDRPLPTARAIPAGRTLLLADAHQLVALREDAPAEPVAAELQAAWTSAQRTRFMALADAAIAANDWDQATDLLLECRERNVDEAWATRREKDIASKSKNKRLKPDAAKAEAVRAESAAVAAGALDEVHRSALAWGAERTGLDRRRALRFVLEQAPTHAAANTAVRGLLPQDVVPTEPFRGLDWLDFLDAAQHTKVAWMDASLDDADGPIDPIVAQSKQQLLQWRADWRPDLKALTSDRLVLFSPITEPGSLAKALATGELVCDALESMFAGVPRVRHDPRPMLVFIYPDRTEYIDESAKLGFDAEWTAGYYSDHLNELVAKSRMFVPNDDTGFATVLPTLAHELTHQWLMDRCPAFQPNVAAVRFGRKAFWIVEGFASLVEQFEFDFVRREFRLGAGSEQHADLIASAREELLIPWHQLVALPRLGFAQLVADPQSVDVPSSVRLGQGFTIRLVNLFYAQSAMLCRYLYDAEDGRYRQQLLDFVTAYYTGALDRLDFEQAFGVSAKELGPKVVEYSRQLVH
jgi:hypothetical protein